MAKEAIIYEEKMERVLKITDKCIKILKVLILIVIVISTVKDSQISIAGMYVTIFFTGILILYEIIKLRTSFFERVKICTPCILISCCIIMNITPIGNLAVIYYFFLLDDIFDTFIGKKLYIMSCFHFAGFFIASVIQQGLVGKKSIEEIIISIIMYFMVYVIFILIHFYKKDRNRYKILNEKLVEFYLNERENLIAKERIEITQELHDSLGHILIAALMNIRCLKYKNNSDTPELNEIEELVHSAIYNIRGCFDKTRKIEENINLEEEIKNLVDYFNKWGLIKVEWRIEENILHINKRLKLDLYRIIRESISNSIRHGEAAKIIIDCIVTRKNEIQLLITDDGIGCEIIEKSIGLNGILNRVKFWDGMVLFISEKNKGFQVKVLIPIKGEILT